jgi:release factor glutamine methyltransferase
VEEGPTVQTLLAEASEQLRHLPSARLDAELLLGEVLRQSRAGLFCRHDARVAVPDEARFRALVEARAKGEPTAYLRGRQEFWSFELEVTPAVLVPRGDTEILVEAALEHCPMTACHVLDLGTGSGAIALAIASERPHASITAVERSPGALAVALRNRDRLGLHHVECVAGDWHAELPSAKGTSSDHSGYAVIVANPPYVAPGDSALSAPGVIREPQEALVAANEGLADLEVIIAKAPAALTTGGWLILEHGAVQGPAVRERLRAAGFEAVETRRDLAGLERVSLGRKGIDAHG